MLPKYVGCSKSPAVLEQGLVLQVQGDLAQASSALSDRTQAASSLNFELEQLRRELSLKQGEGHQAAASGLSSSLCLPLPTKLTCTSGAAAARHRAAMRQLRPQQQQAEAELQKQQRSGAVWSDGEAQEELYSLATTQPGQVGYFHNPSPCLLLY